MFARAEQLLREYQRKSLDDFLDAHPAQPISGMKWTPVGDTIVQTIDVERAYRHICSWDGPDVADWHRRHWLTLPGPASAKTYTLTPLASDDQLLQTRQCALKLLERVDPDHLNYLRDVPVGTVFGYGVQAVANLDPADPGISFITVQFGVADLISWAVLWHAYEDIKDTDLLSCYLMPLARILRGPGAKAFIFQSSDELRFQRYAPAANASAELQLVWMLLHEYGHLALGHGTRGKDLLEPARRRQMEIEADEYATRAVISSYDRDVALNWILRWLWIDYVLSMHPQFPLAAEEYPSTEERARALGRCVGAQDSWQTIRMEMDTIRSSVRTPPRRPMPERWYR
jgi:hypothetical protein